MANLDNLECTLLTAKDCTKDEAISLKQRLSAHNVPELHAISKRLSIKFSREGRYCGKTCLHGPVGLRAILKRLSIKFSREG